MAAHALGEHERVPAEVIRLARWHVAQELKALGKRATRPEAVSRIGRRYREWADIFARGRAP